MPAYFADSWFFIALLDQSDDHHRQAVGLAYRVSTDHIVTHDAVLTEVLAFFARGGARARQEAVDIVRRTTRFLRSSRSIVRFFSRAGALCSASRQGVFAVTDCMSMVVMEDYDVLRVLTNDRHFTQAGFVVVSQ